jgi:hypothetical protein
MLKQRPKHVPMISQTNGPADFCRALQHHGNLNLRSILSRTHVTVQNQYLPFSKLQLYSPVEPSSITRRFIITYVYSRFSFDKIYENFTVQYLRMGQVCRVWLSGVTDLEMSDSEDDSTRLSTEALAALQEFYVQQAEKDEKCRSILEGKEMLPQNIQFDEDWVCIYSIL